MAVLPSGMEAGPPPEPAIPEISVSSATGIPDAPALAPTGADSAVVLRVTARLVDVPLVALDKKSRPLTNLKPDDLQIYDNGARVDLRSFVQTGGTIAAESASSAPAPAAPAAQPAYSNRGAGPVKAATAAPPARSRPTPAKSNAARPFNWPTSISIATAWTAPRPFTRKSATAWKHS